MGKNIIALHLPSVAGANKSQDTPQEKQKRWNKNEFDKIKSDTDQKNLQDEIKFLKEADWMWELGPLQTKEEKCQSFIFYCCSN